MNISEKVPSRLEIIPEFISSLAEKIKPLGISSEQFFNIRLSLEEALVNAIKYGNKMDPQLFVDVVVESQGDKLIIIVKDKGQGFDFDNVLDPTKVENLEKTSGRGIFLIKNLMDEVEFSDGGSQIKMVKVFNKDE
ncbi:MAG: ATP-binding protein [Candidatus Omnitrophica bacterium]|nr:ATP-binding protein [Candidatus Omnitrophota bacterium]